ncbi:TRADD-N-associated membrane domain-containing protein [Streptomyces sp. SAS_275]|uniref:TRADD-N-associated membrane domain-containing protein n=1 Tax=Streptomyces sp. SAS_275 TaxID=3412746 RepID=UPI00403CDC72
MSGQSVGEDLPTEGSTEAARLDNVSVEESPEVATAKAMADTHIRAARIARSVAARKDLLIGAPILGVCAIWAEVIVLTKFSPDSPQGNPYAAIAWLALCAGAVFTTLAVVGLRSANRRGAFEEVCRVEEFNITAASLKYDQKSEAPLDANRALLREYHRLSTNQARSAFRLAQWVMGASALLVSAGAVAVGLASRTATAVTLASLTAFVTALSGYISATLLATYRVSVEQARFYFREPLAGGYLLAAEHLADRLSEPERAAALGRVVDGFIHAGTNVPGAQEDPVPPDASPDSPRA